MKETGLTLAQQSQVAELQALETIFTEADYDALEGKLYLFAMVRGWTGDPMQQPLEVVLSMAREVIVESGGAWG